MKCMKCGREAGAEQVFCDECRAEMAAYPVKPDTPVVLPPRRSRESVQRPVRRKPTAEQRLAAMRRRNRRLLAALAVALTLAVISIFINVYVIRELDLRSLLGRNYSSVNDARPSETATVSGTDAS